MTKQADRARMAVGIMKRQLAHLDTHYSPVTQRMLLTMLVSFAEEMIEVIEEYDKLSRQLDPGIARLYATDGRSMLHERNMAIVRCVAKDGLSRREAAELFGISYERVRQILKRSQGGIDA